MATKMSEQDFQAYLWNVLLNDQDGFEYYDESADDDEYGVVELKECNSFKNEGILTMNKGLVVRMDDGTEFQVTITQSAR